MTYHYIVHGESVRVDVFIARQKPELSRTMIKKISTDAGIWVNGKKVKVSEPVNPGDEVIIHIPEPKALDIEAQDLPIDVLYEDEDIIVINKSKGLVVHPGAGNEDKTLVNALLYRYQGRLSDINGVLRPGIVHRIDKDTSGVLVVARTNRAHEGLSALFQKHDIQREYVALANGVFVADKCEIRAPIGRHPVDRKRMAINQTNGKEAISYLQVVERFERYTLMRVALKTGRTHQIRVHMAHLGHSLVGDEVYGKKDTEFSTRGQLLHARLLGFIHPIKNVYMEFSAELPHEFLSILNRLRAVK